MKSETKVDKKCKYEYADGRRCKCYHIKGTQFCFNHDQRPEIVAQRAIARRTGANMRKKHYSEISVCEYRLKNIRQCRYFLGHVMQQTYLRKLEPNIANSLIYAAQVFIRSFRTEREEGELLKEVRGKKNLAEWRKKVRES